MSKTFMIKTTIQHDAAVPKPDRKQRLQLAIDHIENSYGNRYINSDDYSDTRRATTATKEYAHQEWISDYPFSIKEMSQLTTILATEVNTYAKDYQRFFPLLLQQNITDCLYNDGVIKLKQYHKFMEDVVYDIEIMRTINKLMKNNESYQDSLLTRSEVEALINSMTSINEVKNTPNNNIP